MIEEESSNKVRIPSSRFTVQFHFTDICNLSCIHCYDSDNEKSEKPFKQLSQIIDRVFAVVIKEWKLPVNLSLTGGEPFASQNLFPLLSYLQDKYSDADVAVQILSNGTLTTEEQVKALSSDYPIVKGVQVSLDGVRESTHERIRGEGTYCKALKAWELLTRYDIPVATHMVVSAINYPEAFELTDLAKNYGLSRMTVTRLVPIGRGRALGSATITDRQVGKLYGKLNTDADALEASSDSLRIARNRCDWPVLFTPPRCKLSDLRRPFTKNGASCAVGSRFITLMSDGTALACRRLPLPLGNVLEEDFGSIWNNSILRKITHRHRFTAGKCQKCEFMKDPQLRFSCGGGGALCVSYGQYGDVFQPDPGCSYQPNAVSRFWGGILGTAHVKG